MSINCRYLISEFEMGTENIEKSNSSPETNEVATIPLTIDENNVLEGAREILKIIRPTWNDDDIKFKVSKYYNFFFVLFSIFFLRYVCDFEKSKRFHAIKL